MNEENGFAYQILVLIIIIVIAIAGVLINKLVGKNGVIEKVTEVESKFSKEDILEKINYKVMQKFIELNNMAKENHQNISEVYNSAVVIEFLKQSLVIEEIQEQNLQEPVYDIDIEKLKEEEENIQVSGKFRLEKRKERYMVIYYDEIGNAEEIGELRIQQTI